MVLELHTWGPAFGLPSVDAQCLAAIAYFALALPDSGSQEWVLIPDSDPTIVPTSMCGLSQIQYLPWSTRIWNAYANLTLCIVCR